jgi:hypothetical protein
VARTFVKCPADVEAAGFPHRSALEGSGTASGDWAADVTDGS